MVSPKAKTILIIEDDHDTRVSVRMALEAEGYFVFSAADGRAAIELLRRIKPPSLILLDMVMPLMNGEEFLRELSNDDTLQAVPVVLVSAFPDLAKKLVAQAFVVKPIDLSTLLGIVQEHSAPRPMVFGDASVPFPA